MVRQFSVPEKSVTYRIPQLSSAGAGAPGARKLLISLVRFVVAMASCVRQGWIRPL